ncbi:Oidioi.mRNA.OKI2018_I69.chr1.g2583.t1.cds [Oikopleura dioica]|uniref:Oidioi.mRNA.OKI2018_I69.chr1.g2583.t1.cds n=1 Tax=Oikopleura dioica TaxID=34765 RepID=A0ABN7T0P5_OIKDI|nr:Oidioi.mRNA.OKI2018_I69.chr1.g2583.t1.cds [Oikopleura dioica]
MPEMQQIPKRYHQPFRFEEAERRKSALGPRLSREPNFSGGRKRLVPNGFETSQEASSGLRNFTRRAFSCNRHEINGRSSYREIEPKQISMRQSRFKTQPELWQAATIQWNSPARNVRPRTGNHVEMKRPANNVDKTYFEVYAEGYERCIPGYTGHIQPRYPSRITRQESSQNNMKPVLLRENSFPKTGTFSKMITVLPPYNPFARYKSIQ